MITPEIVGGMEGEKRLKIVFVLRPVSTQFCSMGQSREWGKGRLNIKQIRDDRYLYLSTLVSPDCIPNGVTQLGIRVRMNRLAFEVFNHNCIEF